MRVTVAAPERGLDARANRKAVDPARDHLQPLLRQMLQPTWRMAVHFDLVFKVCAG
jgi:hypothetical protein